MSSVSTRAQLRAHRAHQSDWIEHAARVGLVAYGVVHLMIAWLAVQLAFGDQEDSADTQGAVQQIAEQPFGQVLVWGIAIGMFLLAAWQALEALFGHREEEGLKKAGKRVTSLGKAVIYVVIGGYAVRAALGSGSSGQGGTDSTTATVMDWPAGPWIVAAIGLTIIGIGGFLAYRAWTEKFAKEINYDGKTGKTGKIYLWFGKVGYTAKGLAFGVVGGLFLYAALTHDPQKSGGLDQALHKVLQQPLGPFLLVVIAAGIGCYGLFCFARARHFND